ncbi:hypothetical protein FCM35_KLT20365 [Carex littledalei]|uniref:CCHC-type domain-containing protein n=1 Tax=Carex littledalei TaxID=544730 RepID=A0A833RIJ7_9POAL|nr:hypothetical protein FCM35_KLT20365 [Carex littledalei]
MTTVAGRGVLPINGDSPRQQGPDNIDAWGNHIPSEEGWTVVSRKKKIASQPQQAQVPQLRQWKDDLLKQRRCFKCLAKGHRRYQCKNKLKCLNCARTGNTAGKCKQQVTQAIKRGIEAQVSKISPTTGDFIAIFPNVAMRNQAVDICVFTIQPRVEVQLAAWTTHTGMVYDPTTHKARIKLHNLPLQHWNWEDIAQLVSGFGSLEKMATPLENDNYVEMTILVGVYHPFKVPLTLSATADPCSTTVDVELEGWIHNSIFDADPPLNEEHTDENQHQDEINEARYWEEEYRANAKGGRRLHSYDSRQHSGPVTQNQRRKWQAQRRTGQMERIIANHTGEEHNVNSDFRVNILNGKKTEVTIGVRRVQGMNWLIGASIECEGNTISTPGIARKWDPAEHISKKGQPRSDGYSENTAAQIQTGIFIFLEATATAQSTRKIMEIPAQTEGETIGTTAQQLLETPAQTVVYQQPNNNSSTNGDTGPNQGIQVTAQQQEEVAAQRGVEIIPPQQIKDIPAANTDNIKIEPNTHTEEYYDGPPPGFPGPPKYANAVRRSPRLKHKNTGPYITPEERARLVSKPDSAPITRESAKKSFKAYQAQLDYFKSTNPLSEAQAQLIAMVVGIELKGQLADQVCDMLLT